jgi:hypothetical protein
VPGGPDVGRRVVPGGHRRRRVGAAALVGGRMGTSACPRLHPGLTALGFSSWDIAHDALVANFLSISSCGATYRMAPKVVGGCRPQRLAPYLAGPGPTTPPPIPPTHPISRHSVPPTQNSPNIVPLSPANSPNITPLSPANSPNIVPLSPANSPRPLTVRS